MNEGYRWRQSRLSRGWDPVQMIGRMKIAASQQGVTLPKTWLLLRYVFLWENHRAPIHPFYDGLLSHVFTTASTVRKAG
jgi:hypothetical protein